MTLEECRRFFADEVRFSAALPPSPVIDAFARVPREKFVGPGPWQIGSLAGMGGVVYLASEDADPRHVYHNVLISLDLKRGLNNGQPSALAKWIYELEIKPGDHIFHLGCGVGYYTAIMTEMVGPRGAVLASEVDRVLASRAAENLRPWNTVSVRSEDGTSLDPGPCDAMLINAGVTHPQLKWLDRLREGGRLVLPLTVNAGNGVGHGVMAKIVRQHAGFSVSVVSYVGIYSCTTGRDSEMEKAPGVAVSTGTLVGIKSVRLDLHEPMDSCVAHGPSFCLSQRELPGSPK